MEKDINFYFDVIGKGADEIRFSSQIYNGTSLSAMRRMEERCLSWENLGYEIRFFETREEAVIN